MKNNIKTGVDEIEGLSQSLNKLMAPLTQAIKDKIYWNDDLAPTPIEYKARDGFIPYSHNLGGLQLQTVIPHCEQYEFGFLDFGQCDECGDIQCGYGGMECGAESEGHLDANLRIWIKFEGIQNDGSLQFYFMIGGGNGDAPYFRVQHEATIFEETLNVKSIEDLMRRGPAVVRKMLKVLS